MRTKNSHNQLKIGKPRINLADTSNKIPAKMLVRLMQEFAKSVTKISSKVHKPKNYNEVINDAIHRNIW